MKNEIASDAARIMRDSQRSRNRCVTWLHFSFSIFH
jgi:hypothetical protein